MSSLSKKYEDNFSILEKITESLNKDEIGIDNLVEKTKEALTAARNCMEILKKQQGEFKKLETEFSSLIQEAEENTPANKTGSDEPKTDDPF